MDPVFGGIADALPFVIALAIWMVAYECDKRSGDIGLEHPQSIEGSAADGTCQAPSRLDLQKWKTMVR